MIRLVLFAWGFVLSFQLNGQELELVQGSKIVFNGEVQYDSLKWVISSERNVPLARMRDRSPNAPEDYQYPPEVPGRQIWFPVLDLQLRPGLRMVASFENVRVGDSVCLNGNFYRVCDPLKTQMIYSSRLEHWENQLFIKSENVVLTEINFQLPVSENKDLELRPLTSHWSGHVEIQGLDENKQWKKIASKGFTIGQSASPELAAEKEIDQSLVLERLALAADYLANSKNRNPYSPTYGGLYLFYDMEMDTYRRSDWIWSYGPSIQVLIEASKLSGLSNNHAGEEYMTAARQVAEASLRFQQRENDHPAYGLVMCRYDPRTDSPQGAEGYFSPADSYFLAGWGWMPYYQATDDKRFLEATRLMTAGIDRILGPDKLTENGIHPIVEQDYLMKAGKWKNWTMDESGFGMEGAEQLFLATNDPYVREVGERYIKGLLDHLERQDGLWDRTWHRNDSLYADNGWPVGAPRGTPVLIETKYSTRGLGWAMIGLLSSHGMMPENDVYLKKAIKLSDHLIESQAADGHWDFLFDGGGYPEEVSEKGTALWSLLFYELYRYTKEERHLNAARKALLWCINNQYISPENSPALGGIVGKNRESGVVYRRWSPLICSYTVAWFGLALLEELKLQHGK